MKAKKSKANKQIFSEAIIRLLAFFMGILILFSTAQIVMGRFLSTRIKQQNAIVANQRAKRELGSLIKEKILLLELNFQNNMASTNRYARERFFEHANDLISSLEILLPVLQNGGNFTHKIVVNLNTADEVVEEISYYKGEPDQIAYDLLKDHKNNSMGQGQVDKNSGDIVVEAIAILPKIDEIRKLMANIQAARTTMEKSSEPTENIQLQADDFKHLIAQYSLEAETLFLRCRENSNKIFFDTNNELKKLLKEREYLMGKFDNVGKYFYLVFQVVITIMFVFIFIRIINILKASRLAESENRKLLSAIKQSPLSVIITDRDSRVEYVNPAFEEITGYTFDEVLGQKTSILKSGSHDPDFYQVMWKTLLSGQIWHDEIQNKRKNGEMFWESATIIPVADKGQEITHYVAIKEDMTEKINLLKSYEESNAIFEEIFTNLPVGVVLISPEKRIIQINREAERILGYVPGQGDFFLKDKVCHNNFCTLKEGECPICDHRQSKIVLKEREALKKDGSIVNILKSVIPIKLKGEDVLLEAFMDLSSIKQAERATLEAKNAAESANRAKSEFLANMSHEIRTPMNAIIGFSDILLSSETTTTNREQLKIISQSAHVLLNLINGILDFSKIEAGRVEIQKSPFSVRNLLGQLSSMFFVSARDKKLTLEVVIEEGMPEYALGDELRMRQVLVNLTGNAIKFTRKGGVMIKASYKAPDFFIEVHDTGLGIPQERIQSIFTAFEQVDGSTEREYGGTGLGLSISLSLVRLMGGGVKVKSQEDKGSVFSIRVPMEIPDKKFLKEHLSIMDSPGKECFFAEMPDAVSGKSAPHDTLKQLRCLVVEDSPVNVLLMQAHLKHMKFESDVAENGKIALEMMDRTPYDIILMDLHMPVMNGLQTLEAMKKKDHLSRIPVVAVTADAIKGHGEKYLKAGFDAYISKPFNHESLEYTMACLLPGAFNVPEKIDTVLVDDSSSESPSDLVGTELVDPDLSGSDSFDRDPSGTDVSVPYLSGLEMDMIRKSIELLNNNCEIFNPDELSELSAELKEKVTSENILLLADEISMAAETFDDGILPDILLKLEDIEHRNNPTKTGGGFDE